MKNKHIIGRQNLNNHPTSCLPQSIYLWDHHSNVFSQMFRQCTMTTSNEATWRWCGPTCHLLKPLFDLDACDLEPRNLLPPSHMSNTLGKKHENHVFWHGDLDLHIRDLDRINVHHPTKFTDSNSDSSWDMNYCPVIFVQSWTDWQTEGDAYEPSVQLGRWAQ